MEAEGNPHRDTSLLAPALRWITRVAIQAPVVTIAIGVVVAIAAIGFSYHSLKFRTSRLDLLNPKSDFNQLWLAYLEEFGAEDDTVIVVQGESREKVIPVLDELAAAVATKPEMFQLVLHKIDIRKLRAKGLHYRPVEELSGIDLFTQGMEPLANGDWTQLQLTNYVRQLHEHYELCQFPEAEAMRPLILGQVKQFSDGLCRSLEENRYHSPWPTPAEGNSVDQLQQEHFLATTKSGEALGFVLLRLHDKEDQFTRGQQAIGELRRITAKLQARRKEVKIGLTGLPIMEFDEMETSQSDLAIETFASLAGVTALFVAGLGGIRYPIMCIAALLLGMAWSFGFITFSVGHLNILSVSFAVMLIGMGIDFGIHYISHYQPLRAEGMDVESALITTGGAVGPGIASGAVTTSAAFFTCMLTEFTGIAELGLIAGGGVILCLIAAVVVLPAIIMVTDRGGEKQPSSDAPRAAVPEAIDLLPALALPQRVPWLALALGIGSTVVLGYFALQIRYDHNLLNLQPVGLESAELEEKLLAETDMSVWFALSIAESREEVLALKEKFAQLPTVARVEEVASVLPEVDPRRPEIISRIHQRLSKLPARMPELGNVAPEELGREVASFRQSAAKIEGEQGGTTQALAVLEQAISRLPPQMGVAALSHFQTDMTRDAFDKLQAIRGASDPSPPQMEDLPPALVSRFVGKSGKFLLKVYGRGEIWDMELLGKFVADVKRIDPNATGQPLQTFYASQQLVQSYIQAAVYSLISVFLLALIDFGSTRSTIWSLLPMFGAMVQTFGTMVLLGIPLNAANLIVLPLAVGTGIDYGVHVVHDYLRQKREEYAISNETAVGVLISGLSTVCGFASLMLADHRGLQSLGRVLTLAITFSMINALCLLPAYFAMRREKESEAEGEEENQAEESGVSTESMAAEETQVDRERRHTEQETAPSTPAITPRRRRIDTPENPATSDGGVAPRRRVRQRRITLD